MDNGAAPERAEVRSCLFGQVAFFGRETQRHTHNRIEFHLARGDLRCQLFVLCPRIATAGNQLDGVQQRVGLS